MSTTDRAAKAVSVRELFLDTDDRYEVPPYQRNYTWGEEEISQLIRDIRDQMRSDPESTYHLGNLVVAPQSARSARGRGATYEVIDGQQRLTTLFILLAHLKAAEIVAAESTLSALEYEARPTATRALDRLRKKDTELEIDTDDEAEKFDDGIVRASRIIKLLISADTEDTGRHVTRSGRTLELSALTAQYLLDQVKIVRMIIPQGTDLNRYFEVMNTRGVQLAPVDIVKARLMRHLEPEDHRLFADIWSGCSDMTRYVQMSFVQDDTSKRSATFGENWTKLQGGSFEGLKSWLGTGNSDPHDSVASGSIPLDEAIEQYALDEPADVPRDPGDGERFTSQVSFEVFLLHVLTVTVSDESGDRQLDDKKLVERFTKLLNGQADKRAWVKQFAWDLLYCRLLFDGFIIKRDANLRPGTDSTSDSEGGDWSLRTLQKSDSGNSASASYPASFRGDEASGRRLTAQERLVLLQSALRTTYTSPRTMHWITEVLRYARDNPEASGEQLLEFLENQSRKRVGRAMTSGEGGRFPSGFAIPRIVFTYLDYLLVRDEERTGFRFVYRTSIEHFSPQNRDPEMDWTNYELLDQGSLHSFGNLALVSVQVNSKFSNGRPKDKAGYLDLIRQSPKLGKMSDTGESKWSDNDVRAHDAEMRRLLERDLALLPAGVD